MIVYTENITPRLQYIVQTLFHNHVSFTSSKESFIQSSQNKINYSVNKITNNELWIKPHHLLFENIIKEQTINVFDWESFPVFFKTEGNIPFDFFAASFYLLTRYEEYLPHQKDMYGRYAHENSVAFKNNFLHLPLINLWLQKICTLFSITEYSDTKFSYQPTYDIDIAYSIKHHGLLHNIATIIKSFLQGKINIAQEKILVLTNQKKDPFDVYDFLDELHQQYNLHPVYFFLLAKNRKGYDKNLSSSSNAMKQLIFHHASKYANHIGIHPSWQSGDDKNILQQEIQILQNITQQPVLLSRQHYIRMSFPNTYRNLIQQNIQHDFSMGYGSINGFRASYTLPFLWFDIEKNKTTELTIHPFCFMEANSFFEQKFSALQAAEELQNYFSVVKIVNGKLVTIFHNHFITTQPEWLEWRKMYSDFLQQNFL